MMMMIWIAINVNLSGERENRKVIVKKILPADC